MANNSNLSNLLRSPILFLAFGFGSGLSPRAPGTVGTLVAVPLWWWLAQLSSAMYGAILLLAVIVGIYICGEASKRLAVHDHAGIVWDEFVGFWITMSVLPVSWWSALWGFALFRFFDIVKPWPISWLDKRIQGGLGIMIDDMAAGVAAALIGLLLHQLGWL